MADRPRPREHDARETVSKIAVAFNADHDAPRAIAALIGRLVVEVAALTDTIRNHRR